MLSLWVWIYQKCNKKQTHDTKSVGHCTNSKKTSYRCLILMHKQTWRQVNKHSLKKICLNQFKRTLKDTHGSYTLLLVLCKMACVGPVALRSSKLWEQFIIVTEKLYGGASLMDEERTDVAFRVVPQWGIQSLLLIVNFILIKTASNLKVQGLRK